VGEGLRERVTKYAQPDYQVVTRDDMNAALIQYAYPVDAMLPPAQQKQLAASLTAKALVTSTLARGPNGVLQLSARFTGINDDVGDVVNATQKPGQAAKAMGDEAGQALQLAVKSYPEARNCMDLRGTNPQKAVAEATKAIQVLPINGLAHWCQAVILLDKKTHADSLEATKHLQAAVQGDPLALPVWNQLRVRHQLQGDTAKTVEAYKQMLVIAPTNQPLREEAFKAFLGYGRPDAAQQAAEEGLKLDPTNSDLYDLLSNACVYRENYKCAVDALEHAVAYDSTKADSAFYLKITVMASQQPDTVRLLKWARAGYRKYPGSLPLGWQLLTAYNINDMKDSSIALTRELMKKDPANAVPAALTAAQTLQGDKRIDDAMPFLDFAVEKGDPSAKQAAATIVLNGALPLLQPPQDFERATTYLRKASGWADPGGKVYPIANYYLGLSILQQIAKIDPQAEKQKSCDMAKQEEAMASEAGQAMKAGSSYKPDDVAKFQKYLDGLGPRIASMKKAFCK
jgi:tetratricopeptide (TPR) repeat protein